MRLYDNFCIIANNNDKFYEVWKYEYIIISYITGIENKKFLINIIKDIIQNFFFQEVNIGFLIINSLIKHIKDI